MTLVLFGFICAAVGYAVGYAHRGAITERVVTALWQALGADVRDHGRDLGDAYARDRIMRILVEYLGRL